MGGIGAAFKEATQMLGAKLLPQCARLFYKYNHALALEIAKELEKTFKRFLAESSPAVALVPVLDLPDSQIFHLSCWLSV